MGWPSQETFVTRRIAPILVCIALSLAACTSDDTPDGGSCVPGDYQWATAGGGPGQGDGVNGVALAGDGSVWITGTFIGATTWGTFQLAAADTVHTSMFVAKLGPEGNVVLARAIQGAGGGVDGIDNHAARIRLDAAGNPVLAGRFEGALDVDGVHLVEDDNGNGAAFILGLDGATGTARFGAASSGDTDGVTAYDLAIDASGDVYVTGGYNGTVTFGGITVAHTDSDQGVFVARYSPTSQAWGWVNGWAGMTDHTDDGGIGRGIAVTPDGSVYATGSISGTLNIDGTVLAADRGSFVVKLATADGAVQWTSQVTSATSAEAQPAAAVIDAAGAFYVAGTFNGTATFAGPGGANPKTLTTTAGDALFLAKYDPSGAVVWVQQASTDDDLITRPDDLAYDGQDLYVGGFTQGNTIFDDITLSNASPLFIAKYDTSGNAVWARNAMLAGNSSSSAETGAIAAASPTSGVVLGGYFDSMLTFGDTTLTGPGNGDGFVAQLCN
jgi:hypothetical protein